MSIRSLPEEHTQSEKTVVGSWQTSLQPNTDVGSADIRGWGCRVVQRDPALATASSGCSAGWAGIM